MAWYKMLALTNASYGGRTIPAGATFSVNGSTARDALIASGAARLVAPPGPAPALPSELAMLGLATALGISTTGLTATQVAQAVAGRVKAGIVNVKDYGAKGDGTTDDASAINAALAAVPAGGGTVLVPPGTYVLGSQATITVAGTRLIGSGQASTTLKAKDASTHEYVVRAIGLAGLEVADLTVDANQANRATALGTSARAVGINLSAGTDSHVRRVTVKNTIGTSTGSAVGIAVAAGSVRCTVDACELLDLGIAGRDSDGVFVSGTQILVSNCVAKSVTDTAFVIESSDQSGITGCTAVACNAVAAISTAVNTECSGNFIDGVTGYDWNAGVTGGVSINIPVNTSTGDLVNTTVNNVTLERVAGAGPAINARITGTARIKGLVITGVTIKGASNQGIVVTAEDVVISGCRVSGTTDACVQARSGSARLLVTGNHLSPGGLFGFAGDTVNDVLLTNNLIQGLSGTTAWGAYFYNTCARVRVFGNYVYDASTGQIGSDAGTTLTVVHPMTNTDGLYFGKLLDTNLYRLSAGVLQTDGQLNLGGGLKVASLTDVVARVGTVYYSTTASKLVFKDSAGTVHLLH